jgi:DNA-binding response OmpR family regulator
VNDMSDSGQPADKARGKSQLTVLVIDDDDNLRSLARLLLTAMGHQVILVPDGIQGEAKALEVRPDLILLDIMLPDQSGYQTCANLRAKGYTGRVLLISAMHELEGRRRASECGADGYIQKPITRYVLKSYLDELQH